MNKNIIVLIICVLVLVGGYFVWSNQQGLQSGNLPQPTELGTSNLRTENVGDQTGIQLQNGTSTDPNAKVIRIECRDSVYVPKEVSIKKGDIVVWTNVNCNPTWPASAVHPTHGVYPQAESGACVSIGGSAFDTCHGLERGESWSFRFDYVGSWRFHDHLNPRNNGTVNVAE